MSSGMVFDRRGRGWRFWRVHGCSTLQITLEVRARNSDGFDDATRRTVSENATDLSSRSSEFG